MIDILIFFIFFYGLLISVVGYGILFQKLCFSNVEKYEDQTIIYIGFYGLFLLTLISLVTSLFVAHNFIHNIFLHLIGVASLIFIGFKNKRKYLRNILFISIFTISALLISKTHDDFSYYHLPFTKYLTEQKVIFGMGLLSHGNKLISSLFFLNSTFYLPLINFFSFHFTLIFFLIFFNYFLLKEIILKSTNQVIKYLYLFSFIFFNLSFNRIAEYGTDKAGQLLILILTIKFFQIICFDKNLDNNKNIFNKILILIPLLAFCITLKTYFLSYILLFFLIFFLNENVFKVLKIICFSKSFIIFLASLFFYFLHHFISTGCVISPISLTCFGDNLDWARGKEHYEFLSRWLEQWAKAGAGPNFRIENPEEYIQNFNWVPRWLDYYFAEKGKDQLLLLIFTFLLTFILFVRFKLRSANSIFNKEILFFYGIITTIFFIWFYNHPSLRYGGYSISFLFLSIPIAFFFQKFEGKILFEKNFRIIVILIIVSFNLKNFLRINNELERTDLFKFDNFPFFAIPEKKIIPEKTDSGLTIYKTNGHCWDTSSPCAIGFGKFELNVRKKNGYYFIYK